METQKPIEGAIVGHQQNPNLKHIIIMEQEDGNWKGRTMKNGSMIESRTNDPQTVLQELLTHP